MRDRTRSGLSKRLIRAGVQQDIAMAIAFANYPTDDSDSMSVWAPRVTGKPTWNPTAAFLDAPSRQGLHDLMVLLFGRGPNEYMRQPLGAAASDEVERVPATAEDEIDHSEPEIEQLLAQGGFRFGGDREPVAELNVASDDFDTDLGWCLVVTAAAMSGFAKVRREGRAAVANDLARTLLRTSRGAAALDESTLDQIEQLDDDTIHFRLNRDADGDLVVDFSRYTNAERPAELVNRVAYQMAYWNINDPAYDKALIVAGSLLLDAVDVDPAEFDDYVRWKPGWYVRAGVEAVAPEE